MFLGEMGHRHLRAGRGRRPHVPATGLLARSLSNLAEEGAYERLLSRFTTLDEHAQGRIIGSTPSGAE
jgi:hypothetical protein